jgi:hypothetical protein
MAMWCSLVRNNPNEEPFPTPALIEGKVFLNVVIRFWSRAFHSSIRLNELTRHACPTYDDALSIPLSAVCLL